MGSYLDLGYFDVADDAGVVPPRRNKLQFIGVTIADDEAGQQTVVTITGGLPSIGDVLPSAGDPTVNAVEAISGDASSNVTFNAHSTTYASATHIINLPAFGEHDYNVDGTFIAGLNSAGITTGAAFLFQDGVGITEGTSAPNNADGMPDGSEYIQANGASSKHYQKRGGAYVELGAGGGGSTPTGTGFVHVTSGVQDGAAVAVNLASAHVTGTLPVGNGGTGLAAVGSANTVLTSNGTVNAYAQISNAHVASAAGINCTKTDGNFGSTNVVTTGSLTLGSVAARETASTSLPNNSDGAPDGSRWIYSNGANTAYYFKVNGQYVKLTLSTFVNPTSISNLLFWFDPSNSANYTLVSGAISQLTDLSGNARHFTQATSTARPTIQSAGINSLDTMLYAPANLQCLAGPSLASVATAGEIFMIVKVTTGRGGAGTPNGLSWLGSVVDAGYYPFSSDGTIYDSFASTTRQHVTTTVNAAAIEAAHCHQMISTSTEWSAYRNGTQLFTTATNTVGWSTTPFLGRNGSTGLTYFSGQIGEVIAYGRKLNNTERGQVKDYLSAKWGIAFI